MKGDATVKRKVLHILHGFGPGGAETWLLSAVKYIKEHPETNLHFDFLMTGGVPVLYDEEIVRNGSRIFYIRYSFASLLSFRKKLKKVLIENRYDVIHNHQDFISGWHFTFGIGYLPKFRISHLHNPYNFVHNYVVSPVRWLSFKLGRWLMAWQSSKITATSDFVMDEYGYNKWPYSNKRVNPAYCGFDTDKFIFDTGAKASLCNELGWDTHSKIALFVGRIGLKPHDTAKNQKNPGFAFAIAKELITSSEWKFIFVGLKGDTGVKMEDEARHLQLDDKIKFLGVRADIPRIMSAADTLIFPSLWEGLGMVVVEAQSCGLKVIMSETVPKEAVVCDELITIKNLSAGCSEWVKSIIDMEPVADRTLYAARINASKFSIKNSIKNLISLYSSANGR